MFLPCKELKFRKTNSETDNTIKYIKDNPVIVNSKKILKSTIVFYLISIKISVDFTQK